MWMNPHSFYGWFGIAAAVVFTICILTVYQTDYTYQGRHGIDLYLAIALSIGSYIGRFVMEGIGFSVIGLILALLSISLSSFGIAKKRRRVTAPVRSLVFFMAVLVTGGLVDRLGSIPPGGLGGKLGNIIVTNLSHSIHPFFVIVLGVILWIILLWVLYHDFSMRGSRGNNSSRDKTFLNNYTQIAKSENYKKAISTPPVQAVAHSGVASISQQSLNRRFNFRMPLLSELIPSETMTPSQIDKEILDTIMKVFDTLSVRITIADVHTGPVVSVVDVIPLKGQRVRDIRGILDDLSVALGATVRIVDSSSRGLMSLEIPNSSRQVVPLGALFQNGWNEKLLRKGLFSPLGMRTGGDPLWVDMAGMPHLLLAGETGSGKSIFLSSIITTLAALYHPSWLRMLLVDPKRVELGIYSDLPHLLHPVITDMVNTRDLLAWLSAEMEKRYRRLEEASVRDIKSFHGNMPFIIVVIDEFADLLMKSDQAVEDLFITLAQKSRAVGIHLIIATQRPSAKVITGLVKANIPTRIAFRTASAVDSRIILDEKGAELLLGNGDMLFRYPKDSKLLRLQGAFVSDKTRERVVKKLRPFCFD